MRGALTDIDKSSVGRQVERTLRSERTRLLCVTDLTPRSDNAVQRTVLLAQQLDAEVLFLHAVDDGQSGRVVRMKVNRAQVRLLSQSERMMKHAPQDASAVVRLGKPLQAIAAMSKEWNPDLIIMAAPRRRLVDSVMGTTTERVIRATGRPVLVVSGAAQKSYESVVIATDLSAASADAARAALQMGVLENAYTWVVHAFEPPLQGMTTPEACIDEQTTEHGRRWREAVSNVVVQDLVKAGVDAASVRVSAQPARPIDAIQQTIHLANSDLLVIAASRWLMLKRILFSSVADQVLRRIDCDILAISMPAKRRSGRRAQPAEPINGFAEKAGALAARIA